MSTTKEDFASRLATFDLERRELRLEMKDDYRNSFKNYDKETHKLRSVILQEFDRHMAAVKATAKAIA